VNLTQAYRHLGTLGPGDRAWIITRLSSSAKMKLARGLGADRVLYEPTAKAKVMRRLDARDARVVLDALKGEPSWIVWLVWRAAAWSWRQKVLRGLSPAMRLDVQALERAPSAISPAVTQFLLRALAERIAGTDGDARAPSRFERALRRWMRRAA
jgi:hypothetical protein